MIKNSYLIIFFIFFGLELTAGAKYKPKVCSPHNMESCPSTSVCQQLDNNTGECSCREDYELNPAAENDDDYCIHIPVVQPTTAAGSTSGGGGGGNSGNSGGLPTNSDKTASAISQNEPPNSHHIISGILIPIFIVLVVIGVAYGVKRLNIVRRFRDMIARRNRPFYEDVMMSNDNDDPPLI